MGKVIANRIKRLRIAKGLNQTELAERLKVTQATVSRWEKGSTPDPDKLSKLAELEGVSIEAFIGNIGESVGGAGLLTRLWVRGAVAAGVWALAYEWPETEWQQYSGDSSINVSEGRRYGLVVRGESMNEVFPDGTVLDCVSIFDTSDLKSGQRVIVERERKDGEVEATVKEYVRDEDGTEWLFPRSSDPAFKAPISIQQPGENIREVRVIAKVVGRYQREPS